jgi:hypothetical protein
MNLGKLLFSGKSIVRGSENVRYRESKQIALPKFVSPKNPFAPKQMEETDSPSVNNGSTPAPTKVQMKPPVSAAPKSMVSWTARLNPAAIWRGPRGIAQNAPRPTVQAELSLDSVKVVHNDLSDNDVEVVPIKSRPVAEPPAQAPAQKTWEILGERLLKATAL